MNTKAKKSTPRKSNRAAAQQNVKTKSNTECTGERTVTTNMPEIRSKNFKQKKKSIILI